MSTLLFVLVVLAGIAGWGLYRVYRPKKMNSIYTPKSVLLDQMNEPRPLPMGQKEFVEWSDRIISGALIPTEDRDSLKGILASMILSLDGTKSFMPDAYFIHSLRKAAANEVAHANFQMIKKHKEVKATEGKAELQAKLDAAYVKKAAGPEAAFQEANQRNKDKMLPKT